MSLEQNSEEYTTYEYSSGPGSNQVRSFLQWPSYARSDTNGLWIQAATLALRPM
jgi:hypothetical protein